MLASPWSIVQKSCYSSRSFGHCFVESKGSLRCSKGPNTVPILVRLIMFIASYTIALRLSNIIIP
jgi:hypothetical protein